MFGTKRSVRKPAGISLIAANCEVVGDLHFSDELQVNGTVTGNILASDATKAVLRISKTGVVKGEIRVPNVIVNGKVFGDIHADNHIELAANAQIRGNVYYHLIEMVMGARLEGGLVHRGPVEAIAGGVSKGAHQTGQKSTVDENTAVPDAANWQ